MKITTFAIVLSISSIAHSFAMIPGNQNSLQQITNLLRAAKRPETRKQLKTFQLLGRLITKSKKKLKHYRGEEYHSDKECCLAHRLLDVYEIQAIDAFSLFIDELREGKTIAPNNTNNAVVAQQEDFIGSFPSSPVAYSASPSPHWPPLADSIETLSIDGRQSYELGNNKEWENFLINLKKCKREEQDS